MDREVLKVYAVTDSRWLQGRSLAEVVSQAIQGGATCIQLREKNATTDQLVALAQTLLPLCEQARIPLLIDDDIEAARLSGAHGVHLGQSDDTCLNAREVLGPEAIIGISAQTLFEAQAAEQAGADYVGVGAMFTTATKDASVLTYGTLKEICNGVSIPVVAIGGITASNVAELQGSGIAGAAVVSEIFAANDIFAATEKLKHAIHACI